MDAASPGDTIMVRAGTYRESVKIQTDGLTLRAKGSVTLKPLKYGDGQCYLPGHVAGFCVVPVDFDPSVGSYTRRVRDVTITGFRIVGFDDGVFGFGTENLKVSHVVAIDNSGLRCRVVRRDRHDGLRGTRPAAAKTLASTSETQSTPTPWSRTTAVGTTRWASWSGTVTR